MLKKIISVFLAFSILNANIFALDFNYKEFYLLRNEIAQTIKPITDFDIRTKYRKEYNFKALFDSINHQGFNNNYGQVCDGDFCAPYHTFMRGLIGALIDFSEGDGSILINYTREIRNAVFMGALASRDINNLRKLLKDGIKETVSSCGTNPLFEEIEEIANTAKENLYIKQRDFSADQKAQDNCEKGLAGLSILSVVWENKQQADETADLIYKTLKKRYKSKFSSLVLLEGIAALSFVDTDYSYQLIEQFLTKDSIPSRIGTALREISFQGMYDSEERRIEEKYNNATSYLNRINAMWQYIDEDATMQRGVDPNIFKQVNSVAGQFDDEYLKAAYNVVYNNTLTDIGAFLSTQGERGQKLARKLLSNFVSSNAEEKRKIHIPLILGLIQNTELSYALPAARIINESFYYDIGGGAGSLIAQKSAIEGSNLNEQANNTISEKYYLNRAKVGRVNFILGLFIQVVSMGFLALSIANAVANIYNLASFRLNRLNFIVDMGNGGAAAGKSAQIAQMGKAARSLPAAKPALPQAKAAAALPQAEATQALPQAVETLALPQPEVTSATVLSQPQTPIVQSLVVPNILSKIRNKYTKQDIFTPVAAMANGDRIDADVLKQSLTETSDLGKSVFRLESHYPGGYYLKFSGFLGEMPIKALEGKRYIFTVFHGLGKNPYNPIQVFNSSNEPIGIADVLFYKFNNNVQNGSLTDLAILAMRQDLNVKPVEIYSGDFKKYKNCTTLSYPAPGLDLKSKQVSQVNFSCGLNDSDIGYLLGGADPGDSGGVVAAETSPNNFKAIGSIIFDVGKRFTFFHSFNWLNNLQDKLKYFLKDQLKISITINPRKFLPTFKQYTKSDNLPVTPVSFISPYKGGPLKSSPVSFGEPASTINSPKEIPIEYFWDATTNSANNLDIIKALKEVVSAELMPYDMKVHHPHAVWKLKDKDGNVLFYLKYGTPEEIARTKRLHEVVSNSDLIKNNPLVKINYPQIVAEGDIPLRVTIKNSIEQQLRQIKPGLWGIGRGKVPFVMTALRADGFTYDDLGEPGGRTLAMNKLHKKPITYAEWKEIEKIFEELNKNGVVHPDLPRNFEFARDNNDFLNNDIYDLEDGPEKVENNKEDLQDIKELFERYGIKESNNPGFNYRSQYIGSQFWF